MNNEYLVEMRRVSKRFPGVLANDRVDLTVRAGEIHVLLGENGSGKSTLMSILAGLYRPDEGEIFVGGRRVYLRSPRDAIRAGIGMVHQHFKLVDTFTVARNVVLGDPRVPFFLSRRRIERDIAGLSRQYKLRVDPRARVWQLSVGERQRVEILKVLYRGCRVLVLDEPTAVLTPQEARELFHNLREMAANGRAVVVITHKLPEVMEIADRVTVLRRGRAVATLERGTFNQRDLAWLMVGRDVVFQIDKLPASRGEIVLEIKDLSVLRDSGRPGLQGLSLDVRAGEILGVAGVAGNGQRELAEAVTGLRPVQAGAVLLAGRDITNVGVRGVIEQGVGYIPEDRLGTGLVPGLGVVDNLILKDYRRPGFHRGPFLNRRRCREQAAALVDRFDVRHSGLDTPVKLLSGGNLQRLLLAREISGALRLIVAVYPIRGLDVGATEAVHRMLLEQRAGGRAILLISEDLDEIFKLSDRIAVLYEGRVTGLLPAGETNPEEVGLLMMGGPAKGAGA